MRINVVELWRKPPIYEIPLLLPKGDLPLNTVLYIPLPRWTNLHLLDSFLYYQLDPSWRRAADAIIIRAHAPDASELLKPDAHIAELLRLRFENRPIGVLHWSQKGYKITPLESKKNALSQLDVEGFIKALRYAEMMVHTHRQGALLPDVSEFHYEGPNGGHYSSFFRVGLALQSIDALDGICFWLLPHVSLNTVLILDSWTILSLGLNLNHYLAECGHTNHKHISRVDCIRSYNEPDGELIRRLEELAHQLHSGNISVEPTPPVLVLTSLRSSGRLTSRIVSACKLAGFQIIKTVFLFSSSSIDTNGSQEVFCELDEGFRRYVKQECSRCIGKSPVVKIEPTTYLLEISAAVRPFRIRRKDAEKASKFFTNYAGLGCISVHRNRHDGVRHHLIDIDVDVLLRSKIFRDKLSKLVKPLRGNIDIVISPTHPAAMHLSKAVIEILKIPVINAEENLLAQLEQRQKTALRQSKGILIVDDVLVTGARLRGYKNYLRGTGLINSGNISCLVGVARPCSQHVLRGIRDVFEQKVFSVEQLLLPDWREDECPWCWELKQLEDVGQFIKKKSRMQERYNLLKNTAQGIKHDLFLHWSSSRKQKMRLGPGAIFGPEAMNDADLFASVASTIQQLRDEDILNEQYVSPIAKILTPSYYLTGRFFEPIIKASIVRAARRHDLRSSSIELELMREIRDLFEEHALKELRSELILAIAQDKLPRIATITEPKTEIFRGERGVCTFLKAILGKQ